MPAHLIDSAIYGSAWGTDEMRAIFDERARLQGWLDVIALLAEAQAEVGLIPKDAAAEIRRVCQVDRLDMDALGAAYEETGHSMLGLIRTLKAQCRGTAGEWVYYGATVQDVTDTWMAQALLKVWHIAFRDLRQIEADLLALARTHRDTLMTGRTHGQAGLPITFGFKVAVWVREVRRHIERLKEVRARLGKGQLAGGVGSLSAYGEKGFEVQTIFFEKLGLRPPTIAWISARDTQAEFIQLLARAATTFDKIGHEVYTLQRPEVGEVREGFVEGTVGSITMPHKRNPEVSEHIGTLARLIRHHANSLAESLVHEHERDGRSWKVEWGAIPPACIMTGALLKLSKTLCANLDVDAARMRTNLEATRGHVLSEGVMLALAERTGKQTAHEMIYTAAARAIEHDTSLRTALIEDEDIRAHLSAEEIDTLLDYRQQLGLCQQFVDRVAERTQADRKSDEPFLPAEPLE